MASLQIQMHVMKGLLLLLMSVWLCGTVVFAQTRASVNTQVSASDDDAEENLSDGSLDITSSDLELCVEDNIWPFPDDNQLVGIRFANVQVPRGAIIDSAVIQFTVDETNTSAATVQIYAEAGNNAQKFYSLPGNISARTRTSSSTTWFVPSWGSGGAAGPDQATPNLKNQVQEVVNRSGWATGNSMVFIFEGTGTRNAHAYDGNAGAAPVLKLFWIAVAQIEETDVVSASVYPNPSKGTFIVEMNGKADNIEIINALGAVVYTRRCSADTERFTLQDTPAGIYFVRVISGNTIHTERIIITQ
jgi:hypothetical protein